MVKAGGAFTERNIKRTLHALGDEPLPAKDISHRVNSNKERGFCGRDFNSSSIASLLRALHKNGLIIRVFDTSQSRFLYGKKEVVDDASQ